MTSCLVRPATQEDAAAAAAVLRDSITHLCVAEFRNHLLEKVSTGVRWFLSLDEYPACLSGTDVLTRSAAPGACRLAR